MLILSSKQVLRRYVTCPKRLPEKWTTVTGLHPCIRGFASTSAFVATTTSASPSTTLTKPNVVPLPEHMISKPYNDDQISDILRPYYEKRLPAKLSSHHNAQTYNSKATVKWSQLDYLVETIGSEYPCDVESGTKMNERMTISFEEYVDYLLMIQQTHDYDRNVNIPNEEIMYMAQNDIPPSLRSDITIPGFCTDPKYQLGNGKLYNTMIWIGPSGCISKLHCDPLDNVLMQIIGKKKVYLIDAAIDPNLIYVDSTYYQENNKSDIEDFQSELKLLTSIVDLAAQPPPPVPSKKRFSTNRIVKEPAVKPPPVSQYPNLTQVPIIYETELNMGDILYIPKEWWHAVHSMEYSISINAWWR
jgi:hypothetical protein